jgi:tRNA-dihydrouridine synthase
MRTGWDTLGTSAAEHFAQAVEDAGAAAITVHGRTRQAFFSGGVDLDTIARIKETVSIPVLGNGSILTPQDAICMIERTNVDGLMIGRGAIGNPWIFSRLIHWLKAGELPPTPTMIEKKEMALRHLRGLVEVLGERQAILHGRKHLAAYTKGISGSAVFRESVNRLEKIELVLTSVVEFFDRVIRRKRRGFSPAGEVHAA